MVLSNKMQIKMDGWMEERLTGCAREGVVLGSGLDVVAGFGNADVADGIGALGVLLHAGEVVGTVVAEEVLFDNEELGCLLDVEILLVVDFSIGFLFSNSNIAFANSALWTSKSAALAILGVGNVGGAGVDEGVDVDEELMSDGFWEGEGLGEGNEAGEGGEEGNLHCEDDIEGRKKVGFKRW